MKAKLCMLSAALGMGVMLVGCEAQQRAPRDSNQPHDRAVESANAEAVKTAIAADEVPARVRQAFEREFPGARLNEVKKETYPTGLVHYEFKFVTREGATMEVEFDEDGERLPEH